MVYSEQIISGFFFVCNSENDIFCLFRYGILNWAWFFVNSYATQNTIIIHWSFERYALWRRVSFFAYLRPAVVIVWLLERGELNEEVSDECALWPASWGTRRGESLATGAHAATSLSAQVLPEVSDVLGLDGLSMESRIERIPLTIASFPRDVVEFS